MHTKSKPADLTAATPGKLKKIKNAIFRLKYKIPSWSQLSKFGNNPIARLVILAPLIAQTIRFSEEIFRENIGLGNLMWLYWSLMSISLGQLLYLLYSPKDIKKYGGDFDSFKIDSLQSLDD